MNWVEMTPQTRPDHITPPPQKRPDHYEDLLETPIADDPTAPNAKCYDGWGVDHWDRKNIKFYIRGFRWFQTISGLDPQKISEHKDEAAKFVKENTKWPDQSARPGLWDDEPARQQFNAAARTRPMLFHKAALIIVTCEIVCATLLKSGRAVSGITAAEQIYSRLRIVPAVWNIDGFNKDYIKAQEEASPGSLLNLASSAGHDNADIVEDLAGGYNVTWPIAHKIKQEITRNDRYRVKVGDVRARPGRNRIGQKGASTSENLDFG